MPEQRTTPRKQIPVYMRVLNDDTQEILGHMVEVSEIGLRLETTVALPINKDYYLRLELTPDLGNVPYIVFAAQSKWCKMDTILPNLYRVGFQLIEILPEDKEVFSRVLQKYGA
ncbi:MAG: PilZ domain-containing protein [Anaerolineales bacterium]|nr:PilZ domain-containing protein [Anaerolineales bacterium]